MTTPTPSWDTLGGKNIWPDRVLYNISEEGKVEAVFVIDRGNNRAFPMDKMMLVKLFELLGLTVRIQMAGNLFTLEEFQAGAAYTLKPQGFSNQQVYNARSELRRLETLLSVTQKSDPRYEGLFRTVEAKRAMLGNVKTTAEVLKEAPDPSTPDGVNRIKLRNALMMQGKHGEELEKETNEKLLTMTAEQIQQELDQATNNFRQRRE